MIKSICVIDDNEIDVYQVERVIKKSVMVEFFYSFADGKEAFDHFTSFEKSQEKYPGYFPPTAILLDINMPRMDGFEFLEEFCKLPEEKKNSIVIMMFTSSDQKKDKDRALQFSEVKDYFVKPFSREQLDKVIEMVAKS